MAAAMEWLISERVAARLAARVAVGEGDGESVREMVAAPVVKGDESGCPMGK